MSNGEIKTDLIAPCGMNCALCLSYQFRQYDLNKHGFHRRYCPGCLPRGRGCLFMSESCAKLKNSEIRFCYLCPNFPCPRIKALDKRYRTEYNMSMIDNLCAIQEQGIESFLSKQTEKWQCAQCGALRCCHSNNCLACDSESYLKKYKGK